MTCTASIHTATEGCLIVLLGSNTFKLSPKEVRSLLLWGTTIPLRLPGGIIDAGSYITPHRAGKAIEFHYGSSCWLLPRGIFVDVSTGTRPVAELARIPESPDVVDR
jgi:hypothetical protein